MSVCVSVCVSHFFGFFFKVVKNTQNQSAACASVCYRTLRDDWRHRRSDPMPIDRSIIDNRYRCVFFHIYFFRFFKRYLARRIECKKRRSDPTPIESINRSIYFLRFAHFRVISRAHATNASRVLPRELCSVFDGRLLRASVYRILLKRGGLIDDDWLQTNLNLMQSQTKTKDALLFTFPVCLWFCLCVCRRRRQCQLHNRTEPFLFFSYLIFFSFFFRCGSVIFIWKIKCLFPRPELPSRNGRPCIFWNDRIVWLV